MPGTVTVTDLTKSYGPVQAVQGISFSVAAGEVFGLLGPNGAGKTTTIECLIGLRDPDHGTIEVCGIDARRQPREVKERIGVQLQATALQDQLSVREALALFGSFYRRKADCDRLLERFALTDKAGARFASLSGGQQQRVAMALALINEPELLLLDEPTAGLDPQARRELHGVIREIKAEGRTVLLTTHYIEEAELLCDRVAIIDGGRIIALDTPARLIAATKGATRISLTTAAPLAAERLRALPGALSATVEGTRAEIATAHINHTIIEVVRFLEREGAELLDLQIRKPSLEDVFIELTGRRLRD
jgi:ABC-2 type transport system ATP-binding protein